jgi:hypothetical protein
MKSEVNLKINLKRPNHDYHFRHLVGRHLMFSVTTTHIIPWVEFVFQTLWDSAGHNMFKSAKIINCLLVGTGWTGKTAFSELSVKLSNPSERGSRLRTMYCMSYLGKLRTYSSSHYYAKCTNKYENGVDNIPSLVSEFLAEARANLKQRSTGNQILNLSVNPWNASVTSRYWHIYFNS